MNETESYDGMTGFIVSELDLNLNPIYRNIDDGQLYDKTHVRKENNREILKAKL